MEMTANPSPEMSSQSQPDDSYWAALFEQEEALLPLETKADLPPQNGWTTLNQQPDGRFAWPQNKRTLEVDPWEKAQQIMDDDDTMTLIVTGYNKGRLLVQWQGLQGFVPASQLIDFPQFHLESERLTALREWESQELTLKIIELNREMNRLIFRSGPRWWRPTNGTSYLGGLTKTRFTKAPLRI